MDKKESVFKLEGYKPKGLKASPNIKMMSSINKQVSESNEFNSSNLPIVNEKFNITNKVTRERFIHLIEEVKKSLTKKLLGRNILEVYSECIILDEDFKNRFYNNIFSMLKESFPFVTGYEYNDFEHFRKTNCRPLAEAIEFIKDKINKIVAEQVSFKNNMIFVNEEEQDKDVTSTEIEGKVEITKNDVEEIKGSFKELKDELPELVKNKVVEVIANEKERAEEIKDLVDTIKTKVDELNQGDSSEEESAENDSSSDKDVPSIDDSSDDTEEPKEEDKETDEEESKEEKDNEEDSKEDKDDIEEPTEEDEKEAKKDNKKEKDDDKFVPPSSKDLEKDLKESLSYLASLNLPESYKLRKKRMHPTKTHTLFESIQLGITKTYIKEQITESKESIKIDKDMILAESICFYSLLEMINTLGITDRNIDELIVDKVFGSKK